MQVSGRGQLAATDVDREGLGVAGAHLGGRGSHTTDEDSRRPLRT
jgi:hypothetical protein